MPDFFFADINECKAGKHNCAANANCQNTKGSFVCICLPGYSGNGVSCTGENNTSVFFTKTMLDREPISTVGGLDTNVSSVIKVYFVVYKDRRN